MAEKLCMRIVKANRKVCNWCEYYWFINNGSVRYVLFVGDSVGLIWSLFIKAVTLHRNSPLKEIVVREYRKKRMNILKTLLVALPLMLATDGMAQEVLTLDSCRARALRNNKELKMAELKMDQAYWNRKSAFTKYLPHIDVAGTYMYTSREVSLLNDEQKEALGSLGETVGGIVNQMNQLGTGLSGTLTGMLQTMLPTMTVQQQQTIMALMQSPQMAQLQQGIQGLQQQAALLPQAAGQFGQSVLDAFRTDTRNMGVVSAMFTQPIYMGGKIMAYNKITKYAEQLAQSKYELEQQNTVVAVEETYWNIVQLTSKKKLAQSYLELIEKLDKDVEQMIAEGFATKADGLSVKVKLNEAEVTMIQVDNGLALLKMLLAQQCGMEDSHFTLADEGREVFPLVQTSDADADRALAMRPEMQQLQLASDIYKQKVNVARSEFMPTVALTGGYLMSNPSVFNGFENKFGGMFTVGVGAKIPVLTWGDRKYKVKAAKVEAQMAQLHQEEVGEKIRLQVKQCQQKVQEAQERMAVADKSKAKADENLKYAEYGLKEGVIPLSNVLAAQTAWLSAHSTYVTAQIDVMLADLYLKKATNSF